MPRKEHYDPLELPVLDSSLKTQFPNLQTFFKIWQGVLAANYGVENSPVSSTVAFTVSDAKFLNLVTSDQSYNGHDRPFVDPFQDEPVLQRLVIMTQLVSGGLPKALDDESWEEQELKTVGGRTIELKRIQGQYYANEIPVTEVHKTANLIVFEMEKILWIRPEDIECGIVRLVEN